MAYDKITRKFFKIEVQKQNSEGNFNIILTPKSKIHFIIFIAYSLIYDIIKRIKKIKKTKGKQK